MIFKKEIIHIAFRLKTAIGFFQSLFVTIKVHSKTYSRGLYARIKLLRSKILKEENGLVKRGMPRVYNDADVIHAVVYRMPVHGTKEGKYNRHD